MRWPWQRVVGVVLVVIGSGLVLWAASDKALATYRQHRLQQEAIRLFGPDSAPNTRGIIRLGEHLAEEDPAAPAAAARGGGPRAAPVLVPSGEPLPPGSGPLVSYPHLRVTDPLFRLLIPAINVENVVVEGSTDTALKLGPGHMEGTPLPGQGGNVVLAGHRDYFFWALGELKTGDAIYAQARRGYILYKVVDTKIVKDTDASVLAPTREETITLITCYPLIHPGYTDQRLVIVARRVAA